MLFKLCKRLIFGVILALILSVITYTTSQASQASQTNQTNQTNQTGPTVTRQNEIGSPEDCLECHEDTVVAWQESAHGQATSSPTFQQQWREQGQPRDCLRCHSTGFEATTGTFAEEGVACSTCHYLGEYSSSHPGLVMYTKLSTETCGECHLDTFADWQVSAHGESDMTCINCHNPHTNTLKKEDVGMLCQTCHTDEGYYYDMTVHADEGLLCTDCHLQVSDTPIGEGHAQRHHTFDVDLATCLDCHGENMHYPAVGQSDSGLGANDPGSGQSALSFLTNPQLVRANPSPNSSLNLALLAAVIGLAFGLVGSPLFERWFYKVKGETA